MQHRSCQLCNVVIPRSLIKVPPTPFPTHCPPRCFMRAPSCYFAPVHTIMSTHPCHVLNPPLLSLSPSPNPQIWTAGQCLCHCCIPPSASSLLSPGRPHPPSFPPHIISQLFITCRCLFHRPVQSTMSICLLLLPNPPFPLPQPLPFTSIPPAPCSLHPDLLPPPPTSPPTNTMPALALTHPGVTTHSLQLVLVQPNITHTLHCMYRRWQERMGGIIRREEASRHQKMLVAKEIVDAQTLRESLIEQRTRVDHEYRNRAGELDMQHQARLAELSRKTAELVSCASSLDLLCKLHGCFRSGLI